MRATEPPRTGPALVVIGGLPATGKSTVGRAVARRFGASYLGIDTIRQSLYAFAERDYAPWDRPHLTLDTAGKSPDHTITELSNALALTP
ncbi:hypothetical protein ACFW2M_23630 [Streptomyces albidoflavus]|uniref:AAA family ATPase n=1 Tax=Streptomyces sp. NA13 TaxID=2996051 RepID=UPI00227215EE|nr:hypothetical protein [Streptomyces sp. NA13]WAC99347.1 hypothetical protein OSU72_25830 [Streptomyces sp. NA13]